MWSGEREDAVRGPFVWSECGGFGVLANEGKLCEVVVLYMSESKESITRRGSGTSPYIQQLAQRVNDLIGLDVAKDVDDLAVRRLALGIHDISQRVRFPGRNNRLSCCWKTGFWVHHDLQPDVAGIRLAVDICLRLLLKNRVAGESAALADKGHGRRRQLVSQPGQGAGHGCGCACAMPTMAPWCSLVVSKDSRSTGLARVPRHLVSSSARSNTAAPRPFPRNRPGDINMPCWRLSAYAPAITSKHAPMRHCEIQSRAPARSVATRKPAT